MTSARRALEAVLRLTRYSRIGDHREITDRDGEAIKVSDVQTLLNVLIERGVM